MNNIFFWASDYSSKSGEGKLAQIFIKKLKKIKKINNIYRIKSNLVKLDANVTDKKFLSLIHKYIIPLYGVFSLWFFYFKNHKTAYLNYLPLWNFVILLLLPPNCLLGPITGSIDDKKKKILKSLLEKISEMIIKFRYKKAIFANNFFQSRFKNHLHNFIISDYKKVKIESIKKYDFIFYIRKEFFHNNFFFQNLISNLLNLNFKVVTIGDKIPNKNIFNFGYQNKNITQKIISSCRYSLSNRENLYSFFAQDCLKNNLTVFYNSQFKKYEILKISNLYPINFNDHNLATKQILNKIKSKKKKFILSFKKDRFDNYFNNLV